MRQMSFALKPDYGRRLEVKFALEPNCGRRLAIKFALKPDCARRFAIEVADVSEYQHTLLCADHCVCLL